MVGEAKELMHCLGSRLRNGKVHVPDRAVDHQNELRH